MKCLPLKSAHTKSSKRWHRILFTSSAGQFWAVILMKQIYFYMVYSDSNGGTISGQSKFVFVTLLLPDVISPHILVAGKTDTTKWGFIFSAVYEWVLWGAQWLKRPEVRECESPRGLSAALQDAEIAWMCSKMLGSNTDYRYWPAWRILQQITCWTKTCAAETQVITYENTEFSVKTTQSLPNTPVLSRYGVKLSWSHARVTLSVQ